MIHTLSGDNYFLIKAEIDSLASNLGLTDKNLGITKINAEDVSLEDLKLDLSSYSLFIEKRLIVLHSPSKIKGFEEDIDQLSEIIPDETTLVIVEQNLDKRKGYYKFLKSKTQFKMLDHLNRNELVKWVVTYTKALGGSVSINNAGILADRVGEDQQNLSNELEKLVLYSKSITHDSIYLLSEQLPSSTIFELLDAAFNLNIKKALNIYSEQRLQKVEPEQILAMLVWQLNILAIYLAAKNISADKLSSDSRISPYVLSKTKVIASRISFSRLKELIRSLVQLDLNSKTSNLDLDEGLKNFITNLGY